MRELNFRRDGAQRFRCALSASGVQAVLETIADLPLDVAGVRLQNHPGLRSTLSGAGSLQKIAQALIGDGAFPVRAILFDKTRAMNWSLAWHQDRTVVVRDRIDTPGYGPWSVKAGLIHVQPPIEVLNQMATLRLHLDPVDADNAPLLVAPGSHYAGLIREEDIPGAVERWGCAVCLADAGDVWAYATPIVHASKAAVRPRRRRVLQVDYAAVKLGGELTWLGV